MRNVIKRIYYRLLYLIAFPEYIWLYKIRKKWKL